LFWPWPQEYLSFFGQGIFFRIITLSYKFFKKYLFFITWSYKKMEMPLTPYDIGGDKNLTSKFTPEED
jgi:hypothetical protein